MNSPFAIGVPGLEPEKPGLSWTMVLLHLLAGLAGFVVPAVILPRFTYDRSRGSLTACKSNCKNIATALWMYSSDNGGRYPTSLSGSCFKLIPTCPAAGCVTYTFSCVGNNHARPYAGSSTSHPQSRPLDHP